MIVFKWLNDWFEANSQQLKEQGISYVFSKLNTGISKPSQYVDIEKRKKAARISLWETGECDAEILNLESSEDYWFEYQIIKSVKELNDRIQRLFAEL